MRITRSHIVSLNPGQWGRRLPQWPIFCPEWDGTLISFLSLPHFSYEDKVWVYLRSLPHDEIVAAAKELAAITTTCTCDDKTKWCGTHRNLESAINTSDTQCASIWATYVAYESIKDGSQKQQKQQLAMLKNFLKK